MDDGNSSQRLPQSGCLRRVRGLRLLRRLDVEAVVGLRLRRRGVLPGVFSPLPKVPRLAGVCGCIYEAISIWTLTLSITYLTCLPWSSCREAVEWELSCQTIIDLTIHGLDWRGRGRNTSGRCPDISISFHLLSVRRLWLPFIDFSLGRITSQPVAEIHSQDLFAAWSLEEVGH